MTAAPFGNRSATSGSRTTTFELVWSLSMYLPRTKAPKSERLYSERSSSEARFLAFLIQPPFCPRSMARSDDSNSVVMLHVCDNKQAPPRRHAKCNEAPLIEGMIRIIASCRQGIEEYARSLVEGNTMLPQIGSRLASIPFEAHLDVFTSLKYSDRWNSSCA